MGLETGDLLVVRVERADGRPPLADDVREAFEKSWQDNDEGYRYLAGR